ncbi:hypothetical protein [Allosalinactinospora lopnorensis]|uniref:hypothetical protein n=1 Tax=Allosalinactinospora lopnorensis TaxID=1352348 RepID=UPI000623E383|nr:hypothetical protein [Allosalinactinospora lopnorensis]
MPRALPSSLKVARVLLFVLAGAVGLQVTGALIIMEPTPESFGTLLWIAAPGILALVLGLRLPAGRRGTLVAIVVFQAFLLFLALGRIGNGEPQGLVNLALPILILTFVLRAPSREHLS